MADGRTASGRLALTLAAMATTVGGFLAMTVRDGAEPRTAPTESPLLPPMPTIEPSVRTTPVRIPRRPTPVVITRSSR